MARTVDQHRYHERRNAILQEAHRQFSASGFDRTTTASICRGAGISSGTFFHYFPTKLDALIGLLASGAEATVRQLALIEQQQKGVDAILAYVKAFENELTDPSYSGFVHAIAGVEQVPEVAGVLLDEARATSEFITRNLAIAQEHGTIRDDVPVDRLAVWVRWLFDGAAQSAAETITVEAGGLADAVRALLGSPARTD
ncbi:TetR/AcrR family transcriptional regulator [Nocardiopsis ansamitocini]|nr:TetR/AcrR family transcriptional regulator [Nocardiopsis ansamitocini]